MTYAAPLCAGRAVLVQRGGCSYLAKAQACQAGNASAMVAYDPAPGARGCLRMGANASDAVLAQLGLVSVSVGHGDGAALAGAAGGGARVSIWMPRRVSFYVDMLVSTPPRLWTRPRG